VAFGEPAELLRKDVFKAGDQGILNFVLLKKAQEHQITLRREPMMRWPGGMTRRDIKIQKLTKDSPYSAMLHWSGPKYALFTKAPLGHVLKHFEAAYYDRLPGGQVSRFSRRFRNLAEIVTGRRPWKGYP